jgi:phospholipid-translocating P-type ATPase (flippase)
MFLPIEDEGYRAFAFGPQAREDFAALSPKLQQQMWTNNRIITSLYTWYDFVPKSLFGQFRRLANFYFLSVGILMSIGTYTEHFSSPLAPGSTVGSLAMVMFFTMCMQARDDMRRHRSDADVDARWTKDACPAPGSSQRGDNLRHRKGRPKQWVDVRVGDVLVVENKELLPADLLLLTSSEIDGICYVETSNIDGETNLKLRTSVAPISGPLQRGPGREDDLAHAVRQARALSGEIVYEKPNNSINTFEATLRNVLFEGGRPCEKPEVPAGAKQLLMRGSKLRNTGWVIGLVVNTGADTKVAQNSRLAPVKLSTLEKVVNRSLRIILGVQAVVVVISVIVYLIVMNRNITGGDDLPWYLYPDRTGESFGLPDWMASAFAFIILYNNFVPISMYVSMDMTAYFHAKFINEDVHMYDETSDTPALTRSMNLCSELGQVQYVFSDKTGTLTQNVMQLKQFSVGGVIYGKLKGKRFSDRRVVRAMRRWSEEEDGDGKAGSESTKSTEHPGSQIHAFLEVMAVAHTVVAEADAEAPNGIAYQAESPDEGALVGAARDLGLRFAGRKGVTLALKEEFRAMEPRSRRSPKKNGASMSSVRTASLEACPESGYDVLAYNDFNSTRKRQSVVARTPDGRIMLLCKGADNMMFERACAQSVEETIPTMREHLKQFAKEGLRVLVMARREISEKEFTAWFKRYEEARCARGDRKKRLMEVAEEIERDMVVVGASAIEDKLQEGVPDAIFQIRQAGIKLWVLTGDKVETAMNIGYSARVLSHEMQILVLEKDDPPATQPDNLKKVTDFLNVVDRKVRELEGSEEFAEIEERRAAEARSSTILPQTAAVQRRKTLKQEARKKKQKDAGREDAGRERRSSTVEDKRAAAGVMTLSEIDNLALVVSGPALELVLRDPDLTTKLLRIGQACKVVVACRVSPLQKAQLVRMVKKGISPRPVTLAIGDGANDVGMIQTADVGVGISGKEGLQAVNSSDFAIAQFRFLKRLLLLHGRWNYRRVCKLILYCFYKNIVIGLTMFYYNFSVGFSGTSMYDVWLYSSYNAFLGFGPVCFAVFDKDVRKHMIVKHPELYKTGMCNFDLNQWKMLEAVFLSIVHSLIVALFPLLAWNSFDDGVTNGVYVYGTLVYTCLIMAMFYRIMFITWTWNRYTAYALLFSVGLYLLFMAIYGNWLSFAPYFYAVAWNLFGEPITWACITGVPIIAAAFDLLSEYLRLEFSPNVMDLCVEVDYQRHIAKNPELDDLLLNVLSDFGKLLARPLVFLPFLKDEEDEEEGGGDKEKGGEEAKAAEEGRAGGGRIRKTSSARLIARKKRAARGVDARAPEDPDGHIILHATGGATDHNTMLPGVHIFPVTQHHQGEDHTETTFNADFASFGGAMDDPEADVRGGLTRAHARHVSRLPSDVTDVRLALKATAARAALGEPGAGGSNAPPAAEGGGGVGTRGGKSLDFPAADGSDDDGSESLSDDDGVPGDGWRRPDSARSAALPFPNRPDARNDFLQQCVPAWQRVITPKWTAVSFLGLGGVLVLFSFALGISDLDTYSLHAVYDGYEHTRSQKFGESDHTFNADGVPGVDCRIDEDVNLPWSVAGKTDVTKTCSIDLFFPYEVDPPIYVLYRLSNVHQNHERYFASRDPYQMMGELGVAEGDDATCANMDERLVGVAGNGASAGKKLYPCGLVANTYFDDTFEVHQFDLDNDDCTCAQHNADDEDICSDGDPETPCPLPSGFDCDQCKVFNPVLTTAGIAWETDRRVIQNPVGYPSERDTSNFVYADRFHNIAETTGVRDDRFKTWIRPAAMPTFKKRYARIDQAIPANSQIRITVKSRWNVNQFHGSKSLVFANFSWKGPQDFVLPTVFLVLGVTMMGLGGAIWFKMMTCPRELGKEWEDSHQGVLRGLFAKTPLGKAGKAASARRLSAGGDVDGSGIEMRSLESKGGGAQKPTTEGLLG